MKFNEEKYYLDTIKWLEKLIPIQETYSERIDLKDTISFYRKKLSKLRDE